MNRSYFDDFDIDLWKSDPLVNILSSEARGIWFELLCDMRRLPDHKGVITGTREILARHGRCPVVQLDHAIEEIKLNRTADVTERNGIVTIVNRRMNRAARLRESQRQRTTMCRRNGHVTNHPLDRVSDQADKATEALSLCRSLKGDSQGENKKLPAALSEIADRFESALGVQWTNDAGKWVNYIKSNPGKSTRVIAEVENAAKEGRIRTTPAQYAHQTWKEFS